MGFLKKFLNIFSVTTLKKRGYWILLALLIILCALLLRSCYHSSPPRKHVYLIGRDSTWYPLELLGRERNLIGFVNDLLSLISKEANWHFLWVETSSGVLVSGLENHNYDAIISAIRPNIITQETFVFSELLFEIGPVLVVPQESTVTSLKQMHDKTIGIRYGTSPIFNAIREEGANVYDFTLVTYTNMNRALDALLSNRIDGVMMDALAAYTLTNGFYAGQLKVVTPPFTDEGLRAVVLKETSSEEFIKDINNALNTLKVNGAYDALITKWNLINASKQFWNPQEHLNEQRETL